MSRKLDVKIVLCKVNHFYCNIFFDCFDKDGKWYLGEILEKRDTIEQLDQFLNDILENRFGNRMLYAVQYVNSLGSLGKGCYLAKNGD